MAGTDFFDDDLVRQRESAKRIKMGPGDEPAEMMDDAGGSSDIPSRPVGELNLTRMARHRKEVENQASIATQELDRLRKRQEELESEKRNLEEMRRKHEDYGRGKREMMDHLRRTLGSLERKELEAQRLGELLGSTRGRFKEMLATIEALKEENWPEDRIRDELNRSLGVIEEARMEYNKAMAKIEALKGEAQPAPAASSPAVVFEDRYSGGGEDHSFSHWLKIGFAVSLPLSATLLLLALLYAVAIFSGWI